METLQNRESLLKLLENIVDDLNKMKQPIRPEILEWIAVLRKEIENENKD